MGSRIRFQCSKCGQEHIGLPDVCFTAPVYYENATPEEKVQNFKLTSDTCILNDGGETHHFIRGVMLVPILSTTERFGWGVWVSLSRKNFERYLSLSIDAEIASEPPYYGWFSNGIVGYPNTLNLKARVELQQGNQRPIITLQPSDHPLSKEQHEGITIERALEIAEPYLHKNK